MMSSVGTHMSDSNTTDTTASEGAASTLLEKAKDVVSNHWQTIAIVLLGTVIISFLVALIIYNLLQTNSIRNKDGFLLEGTTLPVQGSDMTKVAPSTKGMPANSEEVSYSFWVYVKTFNEFMGSYKQVFHRGQEATKPGIVGPHAYFDANSNKLHFVFGSKDASDPFDDSTRTDLQTKIDYKETPAIPNVTRTDRRILLDKFAYIRGSRGITIDYIPVQRWVHVVITADVQRNLIKAFVDGEEVKTASTSSNLGKITYNVKSTVDNSTITKEIKYNLDLSKADINGSGYFFFGGKPSSSVGVGFPGLIANVRVFDFALDKHAVFAQYRKGPIDNVLARAGLPAYGLQAPIYNVYDEQTP